MARFGMVLLSSAFSSHSITELFLPQCTSDVHLIAVSSPDTPRYKYAGVLGSTRQRNGDDCSVATGGRLSPGVLQDKLARFPVPQGTV